MTISACGVWGVDDLPPEELHPSTRVEAASGEVAPPTSPPQGAATVTPPAPTRAHITLASTCGGCHPLSTVAASNTRGDSWPGLVASHAAKGLVTLTAEEKSSIVSQLRKAYP